MLKRISLWRPVPDCNPFELTYFSRLGQASQLPCWFVKPVSSSTSSIYVALDYTEQLTVAQLPAKVEHEVGRWARLALAFLIRQAWSSQMHDEYLCRAF